MLFKETVEKDTLSILETLQNDKKLSNFYLVGGTALALMIDATYCFEPINERLHDMKRYPDKVYSDFPIKKNSIS